LKIDRELLKLKTKFEGIKNLEKLPDAILVFDIKKDVTAVREAKSKNILIIGISDTNTNPTLVDHPIVANDDAIPSIKYILERLKETVLQSQKEVK
jgi:small subunit ribosomal protein S2